MSTFTTPGRQTAGTASDGASSGRRVLRSALETLLDAPSPYLASAARSPVEAPRPSPLTARSANGAAVTATDTSRGAAAQKRGFTVTYATRGTGASTSVNTTVRAPSLPPPPPSSSVSSAASVATGNTPRAEPSALLFLSPSDTDKRQHGGRGERGARMNQRRGTRAPAAAQVVFPDTSRSLLAEVEEATATTPAHPDSALDAEPALDDKVTVAPTASGFSDAATVSKANLGTNDFAASARSATFTEEEVRARVAAAVAAYERQRDEEETAVLQQIDKEIEGKERTNQQLIKEKEEVMRVAKSLQAQLTRVMEQFEEMQSGMTTSALEEQQGLRSALSRTEVELCHAQDALRACESDAATQAAQLSTLANELADSKQKLAAQEAETASLRAHLASSEAALSTAQQEHSEEYTDIRSKMLSLGECMSRTEATIAEQERTIAQLQRKVGETERSRASAVAAAEKERDAAEKRVVELQTALQAQTNEVRRRMGTVAGLEAERQTLRQRMQRLRAAAAAAGRRQAALESVFAATLGKVRRVMTGLAFKADAAAVERRQGVTPSSHAGEFDVSATGSPPSPSALERTHPFSSDDNDDTDDTVVSYGESFNVVEVVDVGDEELGMDLRDETAVPPVASHGVRMRTTAAAAAAACTRSASAQAVSKRGLFGSSRPFAPSRTVSAPASVAAAKKVSTAASGDAADVGAEAERSLASLQRSYAACQRMADQLHITVARQAKRVRKRVRALEHSLSTQATALRASTSLAGRLQSACRQLQGRLAMSEKAAKEQEAECEARGEDLGTLAAERDVSEAARIKLEEGLNDVIAQRDAARTSVAQLEDEVVRLHAQLQEAAAALASAEEATSKGQDALETARSTAAQVPGLTERLATAESALATERSSVEGLRGRVGLLEKELASAAAAAAEGQQQLAEVRAQLESVRAQQSAQRGREAREAQQLSVDRTRLQGTVEALKTELKDLRVAQARERAAAAETAASLEVKAAQLSETTRTQRSQLAELAREMDVRRSGEHATLATILETVGAALGSHGHGNRNAGDGVDYHSHESAEGEGEPAEDSGTPARLGLSPVSHSPSPTMPASLGEKGSTGRVRVTLIPTTLRGARGRATTSNHDASAAASSTVDGASKLTGRRKGTALMRREAVQAVQRAVLELAQLQQQQQWLAMEEAEARAVAAAAPRGDSFSRAEWMAQAAVQRSAQRRHSRNGRNRGWLSPSPTEPAEEKGTRTPFSTVRSFGADGVGDDTAAGKDAAETFFDDAGGFSAMQGPTLFGQRVGHATATRSEPLRRLLTHAANPVASSTTSATSALSSAAVTPFAAAFFGAGAALGATPSRLGTLPNSSVAPTSRTSKVRSASTSAGSAATRSGLSRSPTLECGRSSGGGSGEVDGSCAPARPPPLRTS